MGVSPVHGYHQWAWYHPWLLLSVVASSVVDAWHQTMDDFMGERG